MKKLLAIALLSLSLLVGCDTVVHGKVVRKVVHPAGVIFMPIMMSCGKGCMTSVLIPIMYPESYSIVVDGPDKNGKPSEDNIYVDSVTFATTKVGDIYFCGDKDHPRCVTSRPGGQQ